MVTLLFDLDNTLYSRELGVVPRIDRRINEYLRDRVGIPAGEADGLRHRFWAEHGTTLRGLMANHAVDPDDYLEFVHRIELADLLAPDPRVLSVIERLPGKKVVFTNAARRHAARVLDLLGMAGGFEAVMGLEDLDYVSKPHPEAYAKVLARIGGRAIDCAMIDDNRANLVAAKRLGMRTVWVADPAPADESIDHVIASVAELEHVAELRGP